MGMDKAEAIKRIKDHIRVHHIGEYPHIKIAEALNMAISALATDNNVGSKWIPVTERLPDTFGEFIVAVKPVDGELYSDYADYDPFAKRWTTGIFFEIGSKVTCWMPLPEAPKGE